MIWVLYFLKLKKAMIQEFDKVIETCVYPGA